MSDKGTTLKDFVDNDSFNASNNKDKEKKVKILLLKQYH